MKLNWISKQETYSSADISIKVYRQKNSCVGGIIFRNKSDLAIGNNGYIQVAIDDNRLYFRQSNERDGYHVNSKGGNTTKGLRIVNESFYDFCKRYKGDYEMKYDRKNGLYFIEGKE